MIYKRKPRNKLIYFCLTRGNMENYLFINKKKNTMPMCGIINC